MERQNNISKPNTISNRYVNTPSFIHIPIYTDELLKEANNKAKDLLSLNLNKISYFLVRQEFGEEIADSIYKNLKCKSYYRYGTYSETDGSHDYSLDPYIINTDSAGLGTELRENEILSPRKKGTTFGLNLDLPNDFKTSGYLDPSGNKITISSSK